MFLRNSWYVIFWSREIADRPQSRMVLGEQIVVFRTADGTLAALEDRCPHRHLPLSIGTISGETIVCGYHGMAFNASGACVAAPSNGAVPPRARVKSYPAVERYGWVWVWMGEEALADPASIPDFSLMDSPRHRAVGKTTHVAASYKLVTDNLMDLSHVGYVHQSTIGTPELTANAKLTTRRNARGVEVRRTVADVPVPPTYVKSGVLPIGCTIDRWQVIDFVAPSFVMIHVGGAEAGTGALEGRYEHGLNLWVLNAMTPETEHTAYYHWASVRSHALDDPEADALFFAQVSEAFEEDRNILETQQRVLTRRGDSWDLALKSDAGSIEARRVLDAMIAREQATQAAAPPSRARAEPAVLA